MESQADTYRYNARNRHYVGNAVLSFDPYRVDAAISAINNPFQLIIHSVGVGALVSIHPSSYYSQQVGVAHGEHYIEVTSRHNTTDQDAFAESSIEVSIQEIELNGQTVLRRKETLHLSAKRQEPDGCYYADFCDLDVPIAGYDREELIEKAHALLALTWHSCMDVDDSMLAPLAIKLKERLQLYYEEVI